MGLESPACSVDEAPAIQAGDLILAPQCSHQNWALKANRIQPRVGEVETSKSLGLSLPKSLSSRFNERSLSQKNNNKVKCEWGSALRMILPARTYTHMCMDNPTYEHVYSKEVRKERQCGYRWRKLWQIPEHLETFGLNDHRAWRKQRYWGVIDTKYRWECCPGQPQKDLQCILLSLVGMPKGFSTEEGTWSEFSGVFMIWWVYDLGPIWNYLLILELHFETYSE